MVIDDLMPMKADVVVTKPQYFLGLQ